MEFFCTEQKAVKIGDKIDIPTQKKIYDVNFSVYKVPSIYKVYASEKGYTVELAR